MKKYTILFLALVLTAMVFTGCMSTAKQPEATTAPTVVPTTAPMPTVPPTHEPESTATLPSATDDTIPLVPDTTDTTDMTDHAQSRAVPRTR